MPTRVTANTTIKDSTSGLSSVCAGVTSNIGSLNPDLYKSPLIPEEDTSNYPEGHLGRFWFSINYDTEQEKLLINLIRIHNLPSRDKDSTTACDPLVRYNAACSALQTDYCILSFPCHCSVRRFFLFLAVVLSKLRNTMREE